MCMWFIIIIILYSYSLLKSKTREVERRDYDWCILRVADVDDLTMRLGEVETTIFFVQKKEKKRKEKKRNARLIVVSLIDLSQSNSAWVKIIVCIIFVWLTSWYYSLSQSFAHHLSSHDKINTVFFSPTIYLSLTV